MKIEAKNYFSENIGEILMTAVFQGIISESINLNVTIGNLSQSSINWVGITSLNPIS